MNDAVKERSFLDTITIEKIDVSSSSIILEDFTKKLNKSSEQELADYIQLPNAQINIKANIRAVEKIIEKSTKTIYIFSGGINRYVYGQPRIILKIYEWLLEDSTREIKILLKKDVDLMDTLFGTMMLELPNRIQFRVSLLEDINKCFRNCIIGDDRILKLKERVPNTNEERVVVSFNDTESVNKLLKLFESMYVDKYSKETILTNDFEIKTKSNTKMNERKAHFIQNIFDKLNQEIKERIEIESSSNSMLIS